MNLSFCETSHIASRVIITTSQFISALGVYRTKFGSSYAMYLFTIRWFACFLFSCGDTYVRYSLRWWKNWIFSQLLFFSTWDRHLIIIPYYYFSFDPSSDWVQQIRSKYTCVYIFILYKQNKQKFLIFIIKPSIKCEQKKKKRKANGSLGKIRESASISRIILMIHEGWTFLTFCTRCIQFIRYRNTDIIFIPCSSFYLSLFFFWQIVRVSVTLAKVVAFSGNGAKVDAVNHRLLII